MTNFSLENKWINLFKKKNIILIPIFSNQQDLNFYFKKFKPSCVIISGGSNNIFKSSQENLLRRKNDLKLLKISIKNKIPILSVCYGFQYIANESIKKETGKDALTLVKDVIEEDHNKRKFKRNFKIMVEKRVLNARKKILVN